MSEAVSEFDITW